MDDRVWLSYERHLRLRGISAQTVTNYRKSRAKVADFTGGPVHTASRLDLEELLESWIGKFKGSTRLHHYINLGAYFNWCVSEEHISRNPLKGLPQPSIDDVPPRVLSEVELRKLIKACDGPNLRDKRDAAIIRLMSEAGGMRNTEVRLLRVEDIDWLNQVANVSVSKTYLRPIPFGDKTARAIEQYMKLREKHRQSGSPWLWLTGRQSDLGMGITTLRDIVVRRAKKAGLGHVDAKSIRHTAADRAMEAGISTPDMNKLFGWSERSIMTSVYGRARAQQRALGAARSAKLGDRL
ncbi:tyrosine-type recombinase/integrase [Actinoplanes derwentensis]|uniref:Site-specific recombinase XerD n=1 Tax=Actinoplanes derwentensis TaxID=113562 RepID=A0A1H1V600_9ACTN|nr:site-specific integrase [Actinoplanes derwentensis]SDS79806.1 Site-specific recombinase XerD [Actinoplanes derwentensis]